MRGPLLEWLHSAGLDAQFVRSGRVPWSAPSMEARACCHAPHPDFAAIAVGDRWAVEFSEPGPDSPRVCHVLAEYPTEAHIVELFERSLEHDSFVYCGVLNPERDQAFTLRT